MFLTIGTKYKSLEPLESPVEIPDFVVLSGLNGSGKTQLLVALSNNLIALTENKIGSLTQLRKSETLLQPIKFIDHNTLSPNESVIVSKDMLSQTSKGLFEVYNNYQMMKGQNPNAKVSHYLGGEQQQKLIENIAKNAGKSLDTLSSDDFFTHYPLEDGLQHRDIFHQSFSYLFKRYQVKQYENEVNQYRSQKHPEVRFLSDEEFASKYGDPPWILVNNILAEAHLDYRISSPENLHPEAPFELKLVNNLNGAEVHFSDLSSGEKVIMSLSLSLYNARFDMDFPKVLLMDEPDAHLHPSMAKDFLDVIQNLFVCEKGMKVIMTTHSPSTVALAPEESIFIMNKTEPRIAKATKDYALRILTAGVPTLSVNYENRRQVFVESEYDATYYGKIYEKLRNQLVPEISINFISAGVGGRGNCDQVKEIVNKLTGYGNRYIYGIIDWDTKNNGNEFVKVLGKDKRYSIENYIFDPILVVAFLLREKFINRAEFGLDERDRYTDFNSFNDTKLQNIANAIVDRVSTKVTTTSDITSQEIEYVGGRKVTAPSWFLHIQGHELERVMKEIFPELNRFRGEAGLKSEIVNKVIDDLPEFIPKDILILLGEIQNYKG